MFQLNTPLTEQEIIDLKLGVYDGLYEIKYRDGFGNITEKAQQVNNVIYFFKFGWVITDGDFKGEAAMICRDDTYPKDAPMWLPSGDLVCHMEVKKVVDKHELYNQLRRMGKR